MLSVIIIFFIMLQIDKNWINSKYCMNLDCEI